MLDDLDKKILNLIQTEFPIKPYPYKEIASKLNSSEEEIYERIKKLYEKGIIRRIGATFNSHALGYASTLCAAKVPEEKIEEFVKEINKFYQVTHNYLREHEYNIWFTFIDKTMKDIEKKLKEVSKKTGIKDIINLPAKRLFKVRVDLNV